MAHRIEHYEIAAYVGAQIYARTIGDAEGERLLQETLDEESRMLQRLARGAADGLALTDTGAAAGTAPAALMPGVWVTESTGFASVPPRAESDLRLVRDERSPASESPDAPPEAYPENELMVARGEPDERSDQAVRDRQPKQ
jgi:hypothetical protein